LLQRLRLGDGESEQHLILRRARLAPEKPLPEGLGHTGTPGTGRDRDATDEVLPVDQRAVRRADRDEVGQLDQIARRDRARLDDEVDRDLDHKVTAFGPAAAIDVLHRGAVSKPTGIVGRGSLHMLKAVDDPNPWAQQRRGRRLAAAPSAERHEQADPAEAGQGWGPHD
jgi:hypothetical protein